MNYHIRNLSMAMIFLTLAVPATAGPLEDLKSPDPKKRAVAAYLLGTEVSASTRRAVDALQPLLDDPDLTVRMGAMGALGEIGPSAKFAVGHLVPNLKHDNQDVRRVACLAVEKIGPGAKSATPALIDALKDPHLQEDAIRALGSIGPGAKGSVPALIQLLKAETTSAAVRGRVTQALAMIGVADGVIPVLIDLIKNKQQPYLAEQAALAAGSIGSEARAAVPAMIELLKMRFPDRQTTYRVRDSVIIGLGNIGPDAHAAVPALVDVVRDNDPVEVAHNPDARFSLRRRAVGALGRIGPAAKDSVPALIQFLDSPDRPDLELVTTLSSMGPDVVPPLIELFKETKLRGKAGDPRSSIFAILKRLGPEAKAAVPFLSELGQDPKYQQDVEGTLKAIRP